MAPKVIFANPDLEERSAAVSQALGRAVYERRTQLKLSQEDLASKTDLHRTYISDIERGARNISFKTLYRLADGLDMDCARLIEIAEAKAGTGKSVAHDGTRLAEPRLAPTSNSCNEGLCGVVSPLGERKAEPEASASTFVA
jgi:transcriptional regulator with XRE-family HTH domain